MHYRKDTFRLDCLTRNVLNTYPCRTTLDTPAAHPICNGIVYGESTRGHLAEEPAIRGLHGAAHAVTEAINARRVGGIAGRFHPRVRLEVPAAARTLRGRGVVTGHLRRVLRGLRDADPVHVAAAEAYLAFEGLARHPCALVYEGPQRRCVICPGVAEMVDGNDALPDIVSLTILTEPSRLAAADRLAAPEFPGGVIAPRPLV